MVLECICAKHTRREPFNTRAVQRRACPAMQKECPMCGDRMRLETKEEVSRVPGTSQEIRTVVQEWICRECDYYEEVDDEFGLAGAQD